MLNRHNLRIKAFKALYAYENNILANHELAMDKLKETFSPDLNSMELVDKDELDIKKKKALEQFDMQFTGKDVIGEAAEKEIEQAVSESITFYRNQNHRDFQKYYDDLLKDVNSIRFNEVAILQLLIELAFQNKKIIDERKSLNAVLGEKTNFHERLYENKVIDKLKSDHHFNQLVKNLRVNWMQEEDRLRDWYKGILNKDEVFKSYLREGEIAYNKEWEIIDYIVRSIIFKNEIINNYFDEEDLNWQENRAIVRSLVLKSLKSLQNEDAELELAEISYNREDDEDYLKNLFKYTVQNNDKIEKLIMEHLKNWELSRIAVIDKVLIKLAIGEMIEFPSIPIKVTINEYIEISKIYSTPKSKNFVNGMLDVISAKLLDEGVIRKSGRGLIDNK